VPTGISHCGQNRLDPEHANLVVNGKPVCDSACYQTANRRVARITRDYDKRLKDAELLTLERRQTAARMLFVGSWNGA
jgi:hypothetical protein